MGKKKLANRSSAQRPQSAAAADFPGFHPVWLRIVLGVILLAFLLAAYSNSFNGPFLLDNQQIITNDTRLRVADMEHVYLIFTHDYWWPSLASDLYRPITTLTYFINYSVLNNQVNPTGYHIVNFGLNLLNVWLVYALLRQLGTNLLVAYGAAAIFGLHPIATEAVTNIVGRADLLVTFFVLSGTLCYAHSVKSHGATRIGWLIGLGGLSILGVLSKESGVMILPAMFFYDWLYRSHADQAPLPRLWKDRFFTLLPGYATILPALLTFVSCRYWMMTTSPAYGNPFVDNPIELADFFSGRMTAFKVLGQYCGMLIWPSALSCDWSYNQIPLYGAEAPWFENLQSWVAIVLILSLFVLAWGARKRYPLITFGILWFAVAIFPTSNLPITIGSIKGERLLYLPSLGFALIAALGIEKTRAAAARQITARTVLPSAISFLIPLSIWTALSVRTYYRNADWSSEYGLWSSAVNTCPNSFKTYKGFSNYFVGLGTEEGVDQAIAVAEKGVAILENPVLPLPKKDNTLFINMAFHYARKAELCAGRGARDEAMAFYSKSLLTLDKAMEVDHYANATSRAKFIRLGKRPEEIRDVGNPTIYELRAAVFLGLNQLPEAENAANYNLRLNPFAARANTFLAEIAARRNNLDRAAVYFIRSLLFDANTPGAWENLEKIYSILTPGAPGIGHLPNGSPSLLRDNPRVRQHLTQACLETYQMLLDTLHEEDALNFRTKAINNYDCPPEIFPAPSPR